MADKSDHKSSNRKRDTVDFRIHNTKRELIVGNSKMRNTMLNTLSSMETYTTKLQEWFTIDRETESWAMHQQTIHDLKKAISEARGRSSARTGPPFVSTSPTRTWSIAYLGRVFTEIHRYYF